MRHDLKIEQRYLINVLQGKKTFEIRFNDRDFQVGDKIKFFPLESDVVNVYDVYPGPYPDFEITYIYTDGFVQHGYVCMAIVPVCVDDQAGLGVGALRGKS